MDKKKIVMIAKGLSISVAALFLSGCVSSIANDMTDLKKSNVGKKIYNFPTDVKVNLSSTLVVNGENDSSDFVVSWNDVNADLYRVLFWANDGTVYRPTTTALSLSITAVMRALGGSLVVEAYDTLGNSVFSVPIYVEALK